MCIATQNGLATFKTNLTISYKVKLMIIIDSAISLIDNYQSKLKHVYSKDKNSFIVAFFIVSENLINSVFISIQWNPNQYQI